MAEMARITPLASFASRRWNTAFSGQRRFLARPFITGFVALQQVVAYNILPARYRRGGRAHYRAFTEIRAFDARHFCHLLLLCRIRFIRCYCLLAMRAVLRRDVINAAKFVRFLLLIYAAPSASMISV